MGILSRKPGAGPSCAQAHRPLSQVVLELAPAREHIDGITMEMMDEKN